MLFLDTLLDTLAENLALDEALLLKAEQGGPEVLRLWEWPVPAVVLGAGCQLGLDVHEQNCVADGVPLLRRGSGGGTVLLGRGCLLYSLILSYGRAAQLEHVRTSYSWILQRLIEALAPLGIEVRQAGTSDLVLGERKVSGNSQQRKRTHLLHHGTLLHGFELESVERYLRLPPRQPEYRGQRRHLDFLTNLPAAPMEICRLLRQVWHADQRLTDPPREAVKQLVAEKYGRDDWTRRR